MKVQPQQSAEFLRPFCGAMLTDTHHCGTVVGHDDHPHVHNSTRFDLRDVGQHPLDAMRLLGFRLLVYPFFSGPAD
jgi:hypothetical protein